MALFVSAAASAQPVARTLHETVSTYSAGTNWDGFVSQTNDPLGPFSGQSVHFVGGGLEASGTLIYRMQLDFQECVTLSSIVVEGAAFNGANSTLRLLDEGFRVVAAMHTTGGNSFAINTLATPGVRGRRFFLEENDISSLWRYRSHIRVNYQASTEDCPCLALMLVTPMAETSECWPEGRNDQGFISQSADPVAPWAFQAATYRGFALGGSQETLDGANLVYRFKLQFSQPTLLAQLILGGAAFNGPNPVVRLLDQSQTPLAVFPTSGGNTDQTFTLPLAGFTGTQFFVDEFDGSTSWRYRRRLNMVGFIPVADVAPPAQSVCPTASAEYHVAPTGAGPYSYSWQVRRGSSWSDLVEGDNPSDNGNGGSFVASGVNTGTLTVDGWADSPVDYPLVTTSDFRCVISSECDTIESSTATLTLCAADFDCNGFVNGADFDQFVDNFEVGDSRADFDGDGFVTGIDFDLYVQTFETGC